MECDMEISQVADISGEDEQQLVEALTIYCCIFCCCC